MMCDDLRNIGFNSRNWNSIVKYGNVEVHVVSAPAVGKGG